MTIQIHNKQNILTFGPDLEQASAVAVLLHGRGATAQDMQSLAMMIDPGKIRFLIPQAAENHWYPNSAFAPLNSNEPDLSSALASVDRLVEDISSNGVPYKQIVIGGFSQGACLAAEYVARNARQFGGLFVFSGALIGPMGTPRNYPGNFNGMPVFIGGSDVDPWVSHDHLVETAEVFERMGAKVDIRTYAGMLHTVNQEEVEAVKRMMEEISTAGK